MKEYYALTVKQNNVREPVKPDVYPPYRSGAAYTSVFGNNQILGRQYRAGR